MKVKENLHIFCCVNKRPLENLKKSCGGKNSEDLISYLKERIATLGLTNVKITKTLCLGKCSLGPAAVIYPEGTYICYASKKDIDSLVGYLLGKNDIHDLLI